MDEKSTLSQQADLGSHTLTIRQLRFVLWGILSFLLNLLSVILGLLSVWALLFMLVGLPMTMFLLAADWLLPGQAKLHLSSNRLTLSAWAGSLPRPRHWSIPLAGLQVESFKTGSAYNWTTHNLILRRDGEPPIILNGLIGTTAELRTIVEVIQEAANHASTRQGQGLAEIPTELRAMAAQQSGQS